MSQCLSKQRGSTGLCRFLKADSLRLAFAQIADANALIPVTALSSNPALILNPTISYSSHSATGSLKFTLAVNGYGSVTITVTVEDNDASNNIVTRSFHQYGQLDFRGNQNCAVHVCGYQREPVQAAVLSFILPALTRFRFIFTKSPANHDSLQICVGCCNDLPI